jgi:hypothetical protein
MAFRVVIIACLASFSSCGTAEKGGTFDGTGYSLEIAADWRDTTDEAPSIEDIGIDDPALEAVSVDATITGEESDGFAPNLAIVTTPAPGRVDAKELAETNLRTTEAQGTLPEGAGGGAIDTTGSVVAETELGGEPAASYEQVADAPPGEVRQLQLYAIHDGTAYALTYSGLESGQFEDDLADVRAMLDSWTWEAAGST